MKEDLDRHIQQEEGEMFEHAEQVFDEEEFTHLGESMPARQVEATGSTASWCLARAGFGTAPYRATTWGRASVGANTTCRPSSTWQG